MWTFIISKITSIRHLKPFGEIPFVMMITRWWRIILHNPLLTPDVLKLGKSVPVPVAEFSISFISFWDNHLFVYSDEHYRWCSKFCINRNKIDLASVRESLENRWSIDQRLPGLSSVVSCGEEEEEKISSVYCQVMTARAQSLSTAPAPGLT